MTIESSFPNPLFFGARTMNMMDLLKDQLGGAVIGQIGKHVGLDDQSAQSGLGAILPTILGGLMKKASTPSGADDLSNMLDQDDYDGGLLSKLPGMLSGEGGDSSMMSNLGNTVLSSLFGDKVAAIAGLLSKVTGMGSGKSSSLLALLAPLVMSFLGKQKRDQGLDSGGLANLLMSQKDSVANSLPAGMAGTLGLGDLGITDQAPAAAPSPRQSAPEPQAGGLGWLIPVVVLALLGLAAWAFLKPQVPDVALPDVSVPDVSIPDVDVGSVIPDVEMPDLAGGLTGAFDGYRDTLSGITDVESAKEAVPKMEEFNDKLGGMASQFEKLPEAARSGLGDKVTGMLEPIQSMIEKLYAIPGVKPILEPVVANMLDKVKAFIPAS